MIDCMRTHVRKQPIIALYFESDNELKFYNLEALTNSGVLVRVFPVCYSDKHYPDNQHYFSELSEFKNIYRAALCSLFIHLPVPSSVCLSDPAQFKIFT